MNYEHEILTVLREAGLKGLPLRRIALNVFNLSNSLFCPLDLETVYKEVAVWLRNESLSANGSVEKTETRGWYRLNLKSKQVQQMLLDFQPHEDDEWMM